MIARGDALRDARVLELGAGTGLPGIVAASLGARVVQTDRHEVALSICKRNGERNRERSAVGAIEYRIADWSTWVTTAATTTSSARTFSLNACTRTSARSSSATSPPTDACSSPTRSDR